MYPEKCYDCSYAAYIYQELQKLLEQDLKNQPNKKTTTHTHTEIAVLLKGYFPLAFF